MVVTLDYSEELLFFFENGKATKVSLKQYETKTKRRRLSNAYTDRSPLVALFTLTEDKEFAMLSSDNRMLIFNSALILSKASRNTIGVNAMSLKKKAKLSSVYEFSDDLIKNPARYRVKNLPAAGAIARDFTEPDQLSLI